MRKYFLNLQKNKVEYIILATISIFYIYLSVMKIGSVSTIFNKTSILFGSLILLNFLFYHRLKFFIITQFYLVLVLVILEVLFIFQPSLFPSAFSDYSTKVNRQDQSRMVEFMEELPYAKFEANRVIRSQGARGSDFVPEWKSDQLGFKNLPGVYEKKIRAVALGDSFTECMGCSVEDTWPSILSNKYGINTFNLGVQGYAPKQMVAVLKLYGMNFKPEYIIYGYLAFIFNRDNNLAFLRQHNKSSGVKIKDISPFFCLEMRQRPFDSFTSLLLRLSLMRMQRIFSRHKLALTGINRQNANFLIYKNEIEADINDELNFAPAKREKEWSEFVGTINEIKELAKRINAKLIVLHLPRRSYIYYKYLTGKNMPDSYAQSMEIKRLEALSSEIGFDFIRMDIPIFTYMDSIINKAYSYKGLPYFYKDGHLSPKGTAVIAEAINNHIARN